MTGDEADVVERPDAGTVPGDDLDGADWAEVGGAAATAPSPAPEDPDALEGVELESGALEATVLEGVLAERDGYLESLRRLQADFENFRKRTERQQREFAQRATESLLERLLPVLDALDLAVAHARGASPGEQGEADEPPVEIRPFLQIASLLRDSLGKEGLEVVAGVGVEFDPTVHDAVAHEPAEAGEPDGVVVEVLRPGYRLKGRVLRPAMVKVRG